MSETNSNPTEGNDTIGGVAGDDKVWYGGLGDELKGNPSVTKYATPEEAARALIHYSGHFGVPPEQLVRLPKPDDADGLAKVWNTLGRLESPDKYVEAVKVPEGLTVEPEALKSFYAQMHGAGAFTPKMAEAALDFYKGFQEQQTKIILDGIKADQERAVGALKEKWGAAYEANTKAAFAIAEKIGGKDLRDALDETGVGNDPRIIEAFHKVAELVKEAGPPPDGGQSEKPGALTPAQAEAELAKMQTDPNIQKALTDANDPNHAHYVKRRLELFEAKAARPA